MINKLPLMTMISETTEPNQVERNVTLAHTYPTHPKIELENEAATLSAMPQIRFLKRLLPFLSAVLFYICLESIITSIAAQSRKGEEGSVVLPLEK